MHEMIAIILMFIHSSFETVSTSNVNHLVIGIGDSIDTTNFIPIVNKAVPFAIEGHNEILPFTSDY